MKSITATMATAIWVFGVLPVCSSAQPVYDDTRICTISDSAMGWNMATTRYAPNVLGAGAPFTGTQILDLRTLVFSDYSTPEVFGLSRMKGDGAMECDGQGGWAYTKGKKGGYAQIDVTSTGSYSIKLDRGQSNSGYPDGTPCASNFYTTPHASNGSIKAPARNFRATGISNNKKRASMKIDYVCTSPTALGYTMWLPLGIWNMNSDPTKILPSGSVTSTYGIAPSKVVDLSATIVSDPVYGDVKVMNLEHLPSQVNNETGKGGILWIGCGGDGNSNGGGGGCVGGGVPIEKVRLYAGSMSNFGNYSEYSGTATNRGWVKIQYTAPKSTTKKMPYAMKTRVIESTNWDMTSTPYIDLPFSDLGIKASRISNISSVIHSDPDPLNYSNVTTTNFFRPGTHHDSANVYGGVAYIVESENAVRLSLGAGPGSGASFYTNNKYNDSYPDAPGPARAHVSVDFLSGSCAEGPNGFEVDAIPSGPNRTGDCDGGNQPFRLQGAGWGGAPAGAGRGGMRLVENETEDAFTFFSKMTGYTASRAVAVKVEYVDGYEGVAGLSFRLGKGKDAPHATITVDASGVVKFITRDEQGNANVLEGNTSSGSLPVWLRLVQDGPNFNAYYQRSSVNTPPSYYTYTGVGITATLNEFDDPDKYNFGMVVSNASDDLSNAYLRAFTEE